jgi:hypothetical protein
LDIDSSGLKVNSGGSIVLTAIDTAGNALMTFTDTLVDEAVTITGPVTETLVAMNSITGNPNPITFTWNRVSLATTYNHQIAFDENFTQLIYNGAAVGAGTPTVAQTLGPGLVAPGVALTLTPGNTYYWRVQANAPDLSPWSEVRKFTIQPGTASVPTIGSPANGANDAGVNPAFSWSPSSGATMYEFQLAVSTNFANPLYADTMAVTGVRPPVKLDPGTTYFWRVRAVEPVEGDWSTIANFTVAEEAAPAAPPVEIIQTPPPVIEIPAAPPAPVIEIPPAPPATEPIDSGYILAIIIIGAILVIAVIVLIVRTRRTV